MPADKSSIPGWLRRGTSKQALTTNMLETNVDQLWELHKATIRRLYLIENNTLKSLAATMKKDYQFRATNAQYEFKLKQWKFCKNITPEGWRYVDRMIQSRQREGKSLSEVVCAGVVLPRKKVEKAIRRYCFRATLEEQATGHGLEPPDDLPIWVHTPRSPPLQHEWPSSLPWFKFQKSFFKTMMLIAHACDDDTASLARLVVRQGVHKASIAKTSVANERSPAQICTVLDQLIPESVSGENLIRSEVLSVFGGHPLKTEAVETIFFLASNNMPGAKSWSRKTDVLLLDMIRRAGLASLVAALTQLSIATQLTTVGLLHQLFASAIRLCDYEVAESLLRAGVDPNLPVPLQYLYPRPKRLPLGYPFILGSSATPLKLAICASDYPLVTLLLRKGAHTDRVPDENTLLDYAIFSGCSSVTQEPSLLETLLKYQRDLSKKDWIRALRHALLCKDSVSTKILLDAFENQLSTPSNLQAHALTAAIRTDYDEMVWHLLDSGADPNAFTNTGQYALWEAVYARRHDICELLLGRGSLPGGPRKGFPTPLQCASYIGDIDCAHLLLQHGADINETHTDGSCRIGHMWGVAENMYMGRTALEAALYGEQVEMAKTLLKAGCRLIGSELILTIRQRLRELLDDFLCLSSTLTMHQNCSETTLEAAIATAQFDVAALMLKLNPSTYDTGALCAAVHMAIATDEISIIEEILERRGVEPPDDECLEGTALGIAGHYKKESLVKLLLSHGIKPSRALIPFERDLPYFTPRYGEIEKSFAQWSEECGWWKSEGWHMSKPDIATPLELVVAGGDTKMISYFLDLGYTPTAGCTLRAASCGFSECLRILLKAGADVNDRPPDADTALQAAIYNQHFHIVDILLQAGADVNAEPSRLPTAVNDMAPTSSTYLIRHAYTTRTALQAAVELGDTELIDQLLDAGADVNAPAGDDRGATALQLASMQGYIGIVQKLLDLGADCNAPPARYQGRTAIEGAAEHGRIDLLQLLLSSGTEIAGDGRRQFEHAFELASKNGHKAVMRLLEDHGSRGQSDGQVFLDFAVGFETGTKLGVETGAVQKDIIGKGTQDGFNLSPDEDWLTQFVEFPEE